MILSLVTAALLAGAAPAPAQPAGEHKGMDHSAMKHDADCCCCDKMAAKGAAKDAKPMSCCKEAGAQPASAGDHGHAH